MRAGAKRPIVGDMDFVIGGAIGLVVGALAAGLWGMSKAAEAAAQRERAERLEADETRLKDAFKALSLDALQRMQELSSAEMDAKRKGIEELLRPLGEAIGAYQQQAAAMKQQVGQLQGETQQLAKSLKSVGVQGKWGEVTLKRLVELAGMAEHCDFDLQVSGEGARADLVVRLPAGRTIVVDSKASFEGYAETQEGGDEAARQQAMKKYAQAFKRQVDGLASKEYARKFKSELDLVVMFVPNDSFVAAAAQGDPGIIEKAMENKVVVATPSTLLALLKAVQLGWREERLAENAQKISDAGRKVSERMGTLEQYLLEIGKGLGQAVEAYNKSTGSFNKMFLPAVRDMEALGAGGTKPLPELPAVEEPPRRQSGAA